MNRPPDAMLQDHRPAAAKVIAIVMIFAAMMMAIGIAVGLWIGG